MPFFFVTASVFEGSALTTCGLAGTTGGTNAVLPESIIRGRSRQRMVDPSFSHTLWQCNGGLRAPPLSFDDESLARKGCESVQTSVLLTER